ncbi:peptidoglycan D,D-transpeptidase FtsI family protein [Kineococcus gynurae]|uniref:Peptidoglycan D,D-transpeptidase FtsI family protein n=1 Tax=Kineococcus gynurae TaxID=452979 RepID=A0ABV5LSU3_9ACTN
MNRPVRRLAVVVALLFASLFASTTWIQFVRAEALNTTSGNSRQLYAELGRDRGQITVDGRAIATSVEVEGDDYQYLRQYADGPLWAPVTGFYSIRYGATGIERAENDVLAGTSDDLFYRRVTDMLKGEQPRGGSVALTLRPAVQQAASDALDGRKGAVVALDAETGDVLAMVSGPTYDPNRLATHNGTDLTDAWRQLNDDEDDPLVNRAIGGNLYPPGSTFKIVVAAAALESGSYTADTLLAGPARLTLPQTTTTLGNDEGTACGPNDQVSLLDALRESCNTAFASLGMDLGQDAVAEQAQKFGFGEDLSIPLRVTPSTFPSDLNQPQLAQSSIGQFDVRSTPLQVAMLSAAVANDGVLMKPNLVAEVRDQSFNVVDQPSSDEIGRAVSADTAATLRTMMEAVVSRGTGTRAAIPGVEVGGKTGTAQHGVGLPPYAWFTSYAIQGDRKVAVAVVIEDGGSVDSAYGGRLSAPVAKTVMQAALSDDGWGQR